ncbi:MAG: response regulator [Dehalococcoidia bacterium]|nr:response regulator [Dehalococcoidia bacterium]
MLVEDTEEHALLVKRVLEDGMLRHRLFWVKDGEEVLDFLFNGAGYVNETEYPKPDVILLDLRFPKVSGIEVLERMRGEERLEDISVAVLTVSDEREDILRSCKAGAQSYIQRSVVIASKEERVQSILDAIISLALSPYR